MSQTLKNVIANAILKVSNDPAYAGREYATPEAAREDFTKALIELLFPENPSVPAVKEKKKPGPKPKLDEHGNPIRKARSPTSVVSPDSLEASPPKEKKKPGPKPKLDENGEPIKKAKSPKTPAKEEAAPPVAQAADAESPARKPRAPMSEEAKAAMIAKRKATLEAKKAPEAAPVSPAKTPKKAAVPPPLPASPPKAPKKAKKPSAEPGSVNLDKFTPTQKKKLLEIVGEKADKKDVVSYLNGLSSAAFNEKKLEDHFRAYAAALATPEAETQQEEMDLVEVEFDGETYAVNPETKRVYTVDENGNATPVGYVGMAKFADMELEDDE